MIVTAAQYCLQDGGKLTSELAGLMTQQPRSTNGFETRNQNGSINTGSETSKFAEYKYQKEKKRQEEMKRAQEEAEAFEQAAEEADLAAETDAKATGKMTAADIEATNPQWPFGQVYQTGEDLVLIAGVGEGVASSTAVNLDSSSTVTKSDFYGSKCTT